MILPKEAQECVQRKRWHARFLWSGYRARNFRSSKREEGMIISDIADLYGIMGNIECAENLFQKLYEVYRSTAAVFESKCASMFCDISGIFKIFGRCRSVSEDFGN